MEKYPRNGEGLDAYADASDTGYTKTLKIEEEIIVKAAAKKAGELNDANDHVNVVMDSVGGGPSHVNGIAETNGGQSDKKTLKILT
jgi:3-dehydroquinate synthase